MPKIKIKQYLCAKCGWKGAKPKMIDPKADFDSGYDSGKRKPHCPVCWDKVKPN